MTDAEGKVTTTAFDGDRRPTPATSSLPDGAPDRKMRQAQLKHNGDGLVSQTTLGLIIPAALAERPWRG